MRKIMCLLVIGCLAACDSSTKWKSGIYKVHRIDTQQILSLDLGGGSNIGRVMHKVVAVGEDDTWIVVLRNPDGDVTKAEFFYFRKSSDNRSLNAEQVVRGPYSESDFKKVALELDLPEFSVRFE